VLLVAAPARADQVRLVSSVAVRAVVEALIPAFERSTKHTVSPAFGIAADLKTKIEAGEPFDVAILTPAMLDGLATNGLLDGTARPVVARSGLGLMIKAGARKPDVGSVDAFKRTLQAVHAITYVPTGASGVAFVAILEKLGIADAMKARTKAAASGDEVNANIRGGAADLAVLPVSEILPVRGAELGGVFPKEIQTYIVMAAGVNPKSPHAAAARAFVEFLTSAKNTPVITAHGMER
jgi:molybdate transport system substrate-binding protein